MYLPLEKKQRNKKIFIDFFVNKVPVSALIKKYGICKNGIYVLITKMFKFALNHAKIYSEDNIPYITKVISQSNKAAIITVNENLEYWFTVLRYYVFEEEIKNNKSIYMGYIKCLPKEEITYLRFYANYLRK